MEAEGRTLARAIAKNIRKQRLRAGWTLERLAKVTGLSKGYLSQIENNEKTPAINTLTKIAFGLGVNAVDLITGRTGAADPKKFELVRCRDRKTISCIGAAEGAVYESFGFTRPRRMMDAYIVTVSHVFPEKPLVHSGQEIAYVLEGAQEFFYDGQIHAMEAGDAVYFDSDRPHMARSTGDAPARVFVVFFNPVSRE